MDSLCPICKHTNEAQSRSCAKCGSPLTGGVLPRSYLNDGEYDSPLARRVEKEILQGRVNLAFGTLLFIGIAQACWLPIYLASHLGGEEEAERILVAPVLLLLCLANIRVAIWSRTNAFPALIVGLSLYGATAGFVIIRAAFGAFSNAPDAIRAVCGLFISFFIVGILLNGVVAAASLRRWSVHALQSESPAG